MEAEILLCFLSGLLPKPSLRAEPGPVVPRGRPVSFVCSSLVWAQSFHLEKDGRPVHPDQISVPQNGSQRTQVTFNIPAVSEDTAGNYTCIYQHVYGRSERSEPLELQVAEEDSTPPSGGSQGPAPCPSPISVLRLRALLVTPGPGSPLPLHTSPSAFTLAQGPGV
ncbi:Leukocyte-associated immunoglobulin-like receptor 1 [Myotis davidii]|nr:Leukocyte-associated immunoglobulin-like receptor 1 [Myotis davidii]